jgi:uncharacterized protein YqgV (UPF0045/DUF77 family)
MEFQVTLKIKYAPNGTSKSDLKWEIEQALEHLADRGLLTGETSAEVEEWDYKIK